MNNTHELITQAFNDYVAEIAKFEEKGIKAASTRARTALSTLTKLAKTRRAEIQEKRNAM